MRPLSTVSTFASETHACDASWTADKFVSAIEWRLIGSRNHPYLVSEMETNDWKWNFALTLNEIASFVFFLFCCRLTTRSAPHVRFACSHSMIYLLRGTIESSSSCYSKFKSFQQHIISTMFKHDWLLIILCVWCINPFTQIARISQIQTSIFHRNGQYEKDDRQHCFIAAMMLLNCNIDEVERRYRPHWCQINIEE